MLSRKPIRRPLGPIPPKQEPAAAPQEPVKCSKCETMVQPGETFCGKCGTPVKAGAKPKASIAAIKRRFDQQKNKRLIQSGRNTMLFLAGAMALFGIVNYLASKREMDQLLQLPLDDPDFVEAMRNEAGARAVDNAIWLARHFVAICFVSFGLPAMIFTGLYVWAKTHPLPASVAGLLTYLTFMVVGFALNPLSLLSPIAWIVRLAIIGALANAIKSASAEQKRRQKDLALEKARRDAEHRAENAESSAEASA